MAAPLGRSNRRLRAGGQQARAQLRRRKCGGRNPRVEVYRVGDEPDGTPAMPAADTEYRDTAKRL